MARTSKKAKAIVLTGRASGKSASLTGLSIPSQDRLMKFDPQSSLPNPYPSLAAHYREYHGRTAWWLYNPWTGEPRTAHDYVVDNLGYSIEDKA
jgi:hypothetical protein